jgi:hypothetical protein
MIVCRTPTSPTHFRDCRSVIGGSVLPHVPIICEHSTLMKIGLIGFRVRFFFSPHFVVHRSQTKLSKMTSNNSASFVPAVEILSNRIRENSSKLTGFLRSRGQSDPSLYEVEATPLDCNAAQSWRHQLKQDTLELFRIVSGPREYMGHLSMNVSLRLCLP